MIFQLKLQLLACCPLLTEGKAHKRDILTPPLPTCKECMAYGYVGFCRISVGHID